MVSLQFFSRDRRTHEGAYYLSAIVCYITLILTLYEFPLSNIQLWFYYVINHLRLRFNHENFCKKGSYLRPDFNEIILFNARNILRNYQHGTIVQ